MIAGFSIPSAVYRIKQLRDAEPESCLMLIDR
ncbi:hypothetical protein ROSI111154_14435 [Rouxiella silvae]